MDKFKKIIKFLLFPKWWITLICSVTGFPLMIYCLKNQGITKMLSIPIYVLSAYAFTVICVNIKKIANTLKSAFRNNRLIKKIDSTTLGNSLLHNAVFRHTIGLYGGFAINCFYAVLNFGSGMRYRSGWSYTVAGYYIALSVIRFFLVRSVKHRTDRIMQIKRYKKTGILMFWLNAMICIMLTYSILQNRSTEYSGWIIYLNALYTFYLAISAVIAVVKYRTFQYPVMSAAKDISLAAALMSVFNLQTAMISRFGENDEHFRKLANCLTGFCVAGITFIIAFFMILKANRHISTFSATKEGMTDSRKSFPKKRKLCG